ncbi:MAG: phage portal protein [Candidatus Improbicoccus pseudotrichonymphae]|uniref:Phage portal protein n=1 Tax=Candidatus Improbicoccus pseudotrichonymphae TaxID=3033792 RepID=A0AA48HXU6_9FIRM|nr:MAG: phage portal protein [Candidatus Improbicoccus pseudotrichonymphae]
MGLFEIFKHKKQATKNRNKQQRGSPAISLKGANERENPITPPIDDCLLNALLNPQMIDAKKAMNISAVAESVNLISETVSMIPIKLYREEISQIDGKITKKTVEIQDERTSLLNDDTKDTLDGIQFKRAMVRDYLLFGGAYAYINKQKNKVKSINYVSNSYINVISNNDIIFKDYNILVNDKTFKPFEFIKVLRSTKDGATGIGIIEENKELLSVAYSTLLFEQNLISTGGNKRGFISSENTLSKETISALKQAWQNLYSNNQENVIVLNKGLSFKESSNTSVEMQLNENKKSMNSDIKSIFGIPNNSSNNNNFDYSLFIKTAIMPILTAIECALNRDFLLEKEKKNDQESLYFAFDTKEIIKGDIKTRFEAYRTALDSNLMQIDECRYMEDLEPLGLNFIKLGLSDVLYNPATKEVFTPNTGQAVNIGDDLTRGDQINENRN